MKVGEKKKIAILTSFVGFPPGYSLTGIVSDQARMLREHGHDVHLFVSSNFNDKDHPTPEGVTLQKKIPAADLIDYRSKKDLTPEHKQTVQAMHKLILTELTQFDVIFTHDLIFTGWNMPYALGIQSAALYEEISHIRWLHWVHSIPSLNLDFWNIRAYGQYHKIVYPNKSDQIRVAEQFKGAPKNVRVIPHIKDPRTWFDFSEEICDFISNYPGVLQSDIVQILPASTDRLEAKRVREVILIFSKLKALGFSVCLVIANQWATGRARKEDLTRYKQIARRNGLTPSEVIFTSDISKQYETGINKRMLRELFSLSNLFIFPTREESFGLVVPEAALSGGVLLVLNKSLRMQLEISGMTCLYFDFGSHSQNIQVMDENGYFTGIANIIVGRMRENEAIISKTFMRQRYNYDSLYHNYYAPNMEESICWLNEKRYYN